MAGRCAVGARRATPLPPRPTGPAPLDGRTGPCMLARHAARHAARLVSPPTGGPMSTNATQATLAHHLQAFAEGVDALMTDYVEESVLFTPDGPLRGLDAIRAFFDAFLAAAPPELLAALTLLRQDVER